MVIEFPGDLLAALRQHAQPDASSSTILPEAAVMTLKEAQERYAEMRKSPRFAVGDFVTPIRSSMIIGHGAPHIVVDVRVGDLILMGNTNAIALLSRHDICLEWIGSEGRVARGWFESCDFELWTSDNAKVTS